MNWSGMTIGKKIFSGFGLVLFLLLIFSLVSFFGIKKIKGDAVEVIKGGGLNAEMAQREVDHLNWVGKVSAALLNNSTELGVEVDPHKCGFGKWYYGEGRMDAERQFPALKTLIAEIEEPHKKLHESARY